MVARWTATEHVEMFETKRRQFSITENKFGMHTNMFGGGFIAIIAFPSFEDACRGKLWFVMCAIAFVAVYTYEEYVERHQAVNRLWASAAQIELSCMFTWKCGWSCMVIALPSVPGGPILAVAMLGEALVCDAMPPTVHQRSALGSARFLTVLAAAWVMSRCGPRWESFLIPVRTCQ